MNDIRERIVGSFLAVAGITAMVLAFGGGAAHAVPGVDRSVVGSLVRQDSSSPSDGSDSQSSAPASDSSDSSDSSDTSDTSDASDSSDISDSTDDQTDTPTPTPTVTETIDTPNEMPTETATGTTSGEGGKSPLGLILLGGGVITAIAAYAVYRRGA
jgi:hypothetical protein